MEIYEDKRQHQQQQSSKSSRSPSPEPAGDSPGGHDSFRPLLRTPPPSRAGPPPSPPVPTNPIAPVPPEPSNPLPLSPCPVCGRTFVPQSLAKHIKICEKMTVKKRKTFDSSRQRREGTDLEQYLPKNFGLPENSPFLEKSPPNTAKAAPKPKPQSVRNAITKPMAELQKCPHCSRAFGVRAFERHVEWCADKAKILPAAPAQPPPHIADAKQRLNARTQYKAPLARGRRSSQTRDKSSHSRSGSVDSSRGVSPPPPRESGDCRRGRARASESVSSNDCHEDSPHVPVIRNSRNSQNSSSGDANVKARQARLARDLSSTRNNDRESLPTQTPQTKPEPDPKKSAAQRTARRNTIDAKKQQQLKKLEELAEKYKERNKAKDEKKPINRKDKSQIPIPKKTNLKNNAQPVDNIQDCNEDDPIADAIEDIIQNDVEFNAKKNKTVTKTKSYPKEKKVIERKKNPDTDKRKLTVKKDTRINKFEKETSMSLDSLEDCQTNASTGTKNCASIGINTELLCPSIPCVIYDNPEQNSKHTKKSKISSRVLPKSIEEPKIELLYKNPTMVSSCDIQAKIETQTEFDSKVDLTDSNINMCIYTKSDFESNFDESTTNLEVYNRNDDDSGKNTENSKYDSNITLTNDETKHMSQETHDLSAEHFDENYEHDNSGELDNSLGGNKYNENDHYENIEDEKSTILVSRHGSGDTYTKFTENPADLEEFLNITDKMMSSHYAEEKSMIEQNLDQLHTPKTNSLETISENNSDNNQSQKVEASKYNFSDSFQELKSNLKHLLDSAGDENIKKNTDEAGNLEVNKKVCDMEHITVYQLKFYEDKPEEDKTLKNVASEFKLPSISETNKPERKLSCNKSRMQKIYKPNRKYKMLGEQNRNNAEYQTFIVKENEEDKSDEQSITSEAPPLKLPRIENKRLDDNYDPFVSAARQMKELMSSDTNIPKKVQNSSKDSNRTLPILRTGKEKTLPAYLRADSTKMMKDTLNKTYQKTPTLQRMKSFGSATNDNNNSSSTFGSRCSSFRLRNDKKSSQKLNTTFTKSSKENISTPDKSYFSRNSNLNRSFSSYTASNYSTPKPKDKIPKIATSMYHSFQRTTIKQPVKLDKIKRENDKKEFVNLDSILADDNSSMTDSNYIDPRLINENDNLPINVNTILNNPDIISSMESLLTTENLPAKFESFSTTQNNINNKLSNNNIEMSKSNFKKIESNNNVSKSISNNNNVTAPIIDDLSAHYDKIMSSFEQSISSKASIRDDVSLCEDFDIEEFMTSFDEEINKQKLENKRTCSSTTRIVKQSEFSDSNRNSELNSISSSPKISNGMIPVNKSMSLTFSSNNIVSESLFPSSVKRSTSLLDSIQKKNVHKADSAKSRHKADLLEQDIMQSLKDFDKFYEPDRNEAVHQKEIAAYNASHYGGARRNSRGKPERITKKNEVLSNGSRTPNGKSSNDSAYSSLNRISPSKLSICNSKEPNGLTSLEQIPAGSDSSGKEEIRSVSSEEFLAMERSAEMDEPLPQPDITFKELDNHPISDKRANSRASSRRSPTWRGGQVSSSGSEASLRARRDSAPRLSRFCHECGSKFPVDTAKFCIECGVKRLLV